MSHLNTQTKGLWDTAATGDHHNLAREKEPWPLRSHHLERVQDEAIDAAKGPNASWWPNHL